MALHTMSTVAGSKREMPRVWGPRAVTAPRALRGRWSPWMSIRRKSSMAGLARPVRTAFSSSWRWSMTFCI